MISFLTIVTIIVMMGGTGLRHWLRQKEIKDNAKEERLMNDN